jgi:CubicO group peptidase (beta-lactamase class C family)
MRLADTARPFRYNNLDFIVVAAAIEVVTGTRYAQAQADIFAPFQGKGMMLDLLTVLGRDW